MLRCCGVADMRDTRTDIPCVPVRVEAGKAAAAFAAAAPVAAVAAAGCAQCGTTAGKLMACTRCRAASYCSGKCQKLHYPAHKAGCRAVAVGAGS